MKEDDKTKTWKLIKKCSAIEKVEMFFNLQGYKNNCPNIFLTYRFITPKL